jgi:hypothetical protein
MITDKRKSDFALLTRREKDWILGKIKVSKTMQRDIRYRIRKKVEVLQNEELPLLMSKGFFELEVNVNNKWNGSDITSAGVCSVVANDDDAVPDHDDSDECEG